MSTATAESAPSYTGQLALRAEGVSKHFEGVAALTEARLEVRPGEIHALLGRTGPVNRR